MCFHQLFRYLDRFSIVLMIAACLMVLCQITLIYYWVKLKNLAAEKDKQRVVENRNETSRTESSMIDTTDASVEEKKQELTLENFESSFWYWNKFSNYVWCIASMVVLFAALTWVG